MQQVKEIMIKVIESQPDDSSYDEILRELAFERMIERGLTDSREGRVISNEEMGRRIRSWIQFCKIKVQTTHFSALSL